LFSFGFPVLFYPLVLWAATQLILLQDGLDEHNPVPIVVEGDPAWADRLAEDPGLRPVSAGPAPLRLQVSGAPDQDWPSPGGALRWDAGDPRADGARGRALAVIDAVEADAEAALAGRLGVPPSALEAPEVRLDDRSPPRATAARVLGGLVPMVLLLGVLVAGVYPSVELVVGDRARGSLETTLSLACPRWVPLAGRAVALVGLMWASAAGNLFAVALTVAHFRVALGLQAEGDPGFGALLPAVSAGALGVALVQLALSSALIAALYVVTLTPARTHKQGQSVASLVLALGLPAIVAAGLPMVPFSPALAAVPLLGGGLLLREALSGQPLTFAPTAVALGGHLLQVGALIAVAARLTGDEGAWFSGPGRLGRLVARLAGDR